MILGGSGCNTTNKPDIVSENATNKRSEKAASPAPTEFKKCSHCYKTKEYAEFKCAKGKKDGLFSWCKDCCRTYDQKRYIPRLVRNNRSDSENLLRALKKWITQQLPCLNCQKWFNENSMHFDHMVLVRHSKAEGRHTIGMMIHSWKSFVRELIKTQLLCANCHAIKTAQQRACKWNLKEVA